MKEIKLTQGKVAFVDDEDVVRVSQYKWCLHNHNYAFRKLKTKGKSKTVLMHRFVLDAPNGVHVDHINGNGLDNRKCNLRLATPSQNNCNRHTPIKNKTGFRGVRFIPRNKRKQFGAQLYINRKCIYLGIFEKAEDAARAYDKAAVKYHGDFARLNFQK